jgi:hypothetical protein
MDDSFRINFSVSIGIRADEPDQFLSHYEGEVEIYESDRDECECAAKLGIFIVHAEAADRAGISLFEVLEADAKTEPYLQLLTDAEAGNFSPTVLRILKEDFVMTRDMILFDRIEVLPKFRGKRLTHRVTQACLERFAGGSRIAALKAYPLQFEVGGKTPSDEWDMQMRLAALPGTKREATERLRKYYSKMGFVSVRGTDLMIRDLDADLSSVDESV